MALAPKKCPECGDQARWNKVDKKRTRFSIFKAAIGAIICWPFGLAAGLLGKKKKLYICRNCGYHRWY